MINRICVFVLISAGTFTNAFAANEEPIEQEEAQEEQISASETNHIVVITDPEFVPISQYFATELNQLPPSSAGQTRENNEPKN